MIDSHARDGALSGVDSLDQIPLTFGGHGRGCLLFRRDTRDFDVFLLVTRLHAPVEMHKLVNLWKYRHLEAVIDLEAGLIHPLLDERLPQAVSV